MRRHLTPEPGQLSRYSDEIQAGRMGFDSQQGKDFSILHSIQTTSGAHPVSYPMGYRG
jgi:hypothetical protein